MEYILFDWVNIIFLVFILRYVLFVYFEVVILFKEKFIILVFFGEFY